MITQYNSRILYVFLLFCFLYSCILFNLYLIQIKNHDFYIHLGQKQYGGTITQAPPRATIYDRHGTPLALNKDSVAAFIIPNDLESASLLKPFLKKYFPAAYERLKSYADASFMYVKRRLTQEEIELIQQHAIADIKLLIEPSRFYPVQGTGQLIGITDIDNNGLFGTELYYNQQLAGTPSTFMLEKDARSNRFYFKKETKIQGSNGTPLTLTIDATIQFLVHEELQATIDHFHAQEGAAIVMNPCTGEILAMTSIPTFDPNAPYESLTDLSITKNKVVTEVYELGSVFKVCAALAALEEGVVDLEEPIDCENKLTTYYEHRKINTVPHSVAGIIPFREVIAKSNNIGIAKVAKRLGPKIYEHYCKLGFGTKTGIQFPGEQKGFINHPNNWSKQSIISLSYGYEVSASLLQLARAFSIIANDGYDVVPYLVAPNKLACPQQLFSERSIAAIKEILTKRNAQTEGYTLMRKTGTANRLIDGHYDPTKNLFTCAGIVQAGDYQRVIVVFIKEIPQKNIYAATVAAPLFEAIAKKLLIHDKKI